ncbi:MAG TPA: 50S ribosomal protein L30 [Acidimicrobiia bacterium]|jgi:large subunit ribosomal protein L30
MAKTKDKTVKVTLRRSLIGEKPKTRATVAGLGLRNINQTIEHVDSPSFRGMLHKVRHLVEVEESK